MNLCGALGELYRLCDALHKSGMSAVARTGQALRHALSTAQILSAVAD